MHSKLTTLKLKSALDNTSTTLNRRVGAGGRRDAQLLRHVLCGRDLEDVGDITGAIEAILRHAPRGTTLEMVRALLVPLVDAGSADLETRLRHAVRVMRPEMLATRPALTAEELHSAWLAFRRDWDAADEETRAVFQAIVDAENAD